MLYIVASCHIIQFQGKLIIQTQENGKKNFILGLIVSSYHPIQLKVKIMDQTWENGEKVISGLILACLAKIWAANFVSWVLFLLDAKHCSKLSLCAVLRKKYNPNPRKWRKISLLAWFKPIASKFEPPIFFQNSGFVSH